MRESILKLAAKQDRKQADLLLDKDPLQNKGAIQFWNKEANDLETSQEQSAEAAKNEFAALIKNCDVGPQKDKSAPP